MTQGSFAWMVKHDRRCFFKGEYTPADSTSTRRESVSVRLRSLRKVESAISEHSGNSAEFGVLAHTRPTRRDATPKTVNWNRRSSASRRRRRVGWCVLTRTRFGSVDADEYHASCVRLLRRSTTVQWRRRPCGYLGDVVLPGSARI